MVVYTQYDPELGEKVFVVRGAERYTHSTICDLEVNYLANHRSYLSVDFTATVKHHVGASSVAFYDGETFLGSANITESQSTVTFNAHVEYGYHKLYAKFVGNAQCLSSKSPITELTVDEPDLPTPVFEANITDGEGIVTDEIMDSYATLNIALKNDGNFLSNKSCDIFLDNGEYETISTSNVSLEVPVEPLTHGMHTIKITFDGDDEYLAAETTLDLYVGYRLTAVLDRTSVVIGETVNVEAELTSYKTNNGIVGELISLEGLDVEVETDNDGRATLPLHVQDVLRTITVSHERSHFEIDLPIFVATIERIEMTPSSTITCLDNNTLISVVPRLADGTAVPNLGVDVNGVTYVTDEDGVIQYVHTGTGAGLTTISASCLDVSNSIEIEDVFRYWNTSEKYNWYYSIVNNVTVAELSQGLRLQSARTGSGQVYFGYSNSKTEDWIFEFTVKSVTNNNRAGELLVCIYNLGQIAANTKIRVEKQGNVQNFYVNDTLVKTNTDSTWFVPFLTTNGSTVLINDIKIMRL